MRPRSRRRGNARKARYIGMAVLLIG
ncbi:MAG: hypothetical protein K0Q63_2184, partial [Paenibacillus sp.]|nr:hypothetical protein [Paenibacillus sp.]